jgi:hypothetical protein
MRHRLAIVFAIALIHAVPRAQEPLSRGKLNRVQGGTAFISVGRPSAWEPIISGSGFLVEVQRSREKDPSTKKKLKVGYVITSAHVVDEVLQVDTHVSAVLRDDDDRPVPHRAELVVIDLERDVAVLRIKAVDLPRPLKLARDEDFAETQPLWVAGFPFDQGQKIGQDLAAALTPAQVSGLTRDGQDRLASLQLQGDIHPGNSGGPLLTEDGEVIGMVAAPVDGTRPASGIPLWQPLELQNDCPGLFKVRGGWSEALSISPGREVAGCFLSFTVYLNENVKRPPRSMEALCLPFDDLEEPPGRGADGTWELLPDDASVTPLERVGDTPRASGVLALGPGDRPEHLEYVVQPVYDRGRRQIVGEPRYVGFQWRPRERPARQWRAVVRPLDRERDPCPPRGDPGERHAVRERILGPLTRSQGFEHGQLTPLATGPVLDAAWGFGHDPELLILTKGARVHRVIGPGFVECQSLDLEPGATGLSGGYGTLIQSPATGKIVRIASRNLEVLEEIEVDPWKQMGLTSTRRVPFTSDGRSFKCLEVPSGSRGRSRVIGKACECPEEIRALLMASWGGGQVVIVVGDERVHQLDRQGRHQGSSAPLGLDASTLVVSDGPLQLAMRSRDGSRYDILRPGQGLSPATSFPCSGFDRLIVLGREGQYQVAVQDADDLVLLDETGAPVASCPGVCAGKRIERGRLHSDGVQLLLLAEGELHLVRLPAGPR